jgi:hypothetical protein
LQLSTAYNICKEQIRACLLLVTIFAPINAVRILKIEGLKAFLTARL